MGDPTPRPGSPAAVQRGCTCPRMDNSHGAGIAGDGDKLGWLITGNCPLHGVAQQEVRANG